MKHTGILAVLGLAAALAAGCGAPEPEAPAATKPAAKAAPGIDAADQIAAPDAGDPTKIEAIAGAGEAGVEVEQTAGGRDLCDPSVSEARRRAAGVDCSAQVEIGGPAAPASLAKDPLLQPSNSEIEKDLEDLGLGEDVPATVILQR